MAKDNFNMLLIALVAIVAVVGLVVLFKGETTGAAGCAPGETLTMEYGPMGGAMVCKATQDIYMIDHGRPIGEQGAWEKRPVPYWQYREPYVSGTYNP